ETRGYGDLKWGSRIKGQDDAPVTLTVPFRSSRGDDADVRSAQDDVESPAHIVALQAGTPRFRRDTPEASQAARLSQRCGVMPTSEEYRRRSQRTKPCGRQRCRDNTAKGSSESHVGVFHVFRTLGSAKQGNTWGAKLARHATRATPCSPMTVDRD